MTNEQRETLSGVPKRTRKQQLTRKQSRRVREMMLDEGATRAEAIAWVLAFEPDEVAS